MALDDLRADVIATRVPREGSISAMDFIDVAPTSAERALKPGGLVFNDFAV